MKNDSEILIRYQILSSFAINKISFSWNPANFLPMLFSLLPPFSLPKPVFFQINAQISKSLSVLTYILEHKTRFMVKIVDGLGYKRR
jgi:hypothetical protein